MGSLQPPGQKLPVLGPLSWELPGKPPCGEELGLLQAERAAMSRQSAGL